MKTGRVLWGVMLLAAFLSCSRAKPGFCPPATSAGSTLAAIDSLMGQQPDSALSLLLAFSQTHDTERLAPYDRHRFHLFLSEALYKNDCGQSNRDAVLKARPYFDSLSEAFPKDPALALLSARAHYMQGVGGYEKDSVVEACREYLQALEVMEGRFEEKELTGEKARFMALTYTRLTEMFSDFYLHNQAIYYGRQSMAYLSKYEACPNHLASMLEYIGMHYQMSGQLDSADTYYRQALGMVRDTSSLTFRDIVGHYTYLSYYQKRENTDDVLEQITSLLSQAESDEEILARSLTVGGIYFREKRFDVVAEYLRQVYHETSDLEIKRQAAEWLVEICKSQNKQKEAAAYAVFLAQFATLGETQSTVKSKVTELCWQYELEKQERVYHDGKLKAGNRVLVMLLSLVVLSVVLFLWLWRRHRSRLRCAERQHEQVMQGRDRELEAKEEELSLLKERMEAASFTEETVCRHILRVMQREHFKAHMDCAIYKEFALDKIQLMALHDAVDRHFPNFTTDLRKAYPTLTKDDLNYCRLYLLDLNEAEVSALMQRAYTTVCDRSRKLKRVFGTADHPSVFLRDKVMR